MKFLIVGVLRNKTNGQYYVLVSHHKIFALWPMKELHQSNEQLPLNNPHEKNGRLDEFRFSFFKMPVNGNRKIYDSQYLIDKNIKLK